MNITKQPPTPAEARAQQLADYLAADPSLSPYIMRGDDGRPELFWSESQSSKLSRLMGSYMGCIICWHPSIEPTINDGKGGDDIMRVHVPVVVAAAAALQGDAMPVASRLAAAVISRGLELARDVQYSGECPTISSISEVSLSQLGSSFARSVGQVITFTFRYHHHYKLNP